jgi:hypothetical protein
MYSYSRLHSPMELADTVNLCSFSSEVILCVIHHLTYVLIGSISSAGGFLRPIILLPVVRQEDSWQRNLMNGTKMALVKMVQSIWRLRGSGGS